MYLFDKINEFLIVTDQKKSIRARKYADLLGLPSNAELTDIDPIFPKCELLREMMAPLCEATTKKFVISDEATQAIVSAVRSKPPSVASCLNVLRIPWRSFWIEYNGKARSAALREVSEDAWALREGEYVLPTHMPDKIGMLVETSDDGRSGTVKIAWMAEENVSKARTTWVVDFAACILRFDFDKQYSKPLTQQIEKDKPEEEFDFRNENSYLQWLVAASGAQETPENLDAANRIYRSFQTAFLYEHIQVHKKAAMFECFMKGLPVSAFEKSMSTVMSSAEGDAGSEILPFLATIMLMTAIGGTNFEHRDMSKLNKQRVKSRKTPLFDHEIVTMKLDRRQREVARQMGIGTSGAALSRRPHIVAGHFVNRNEKIFWRRSHMRGHLAKGESIQQKTVIVKP